jgi:AcrR family transcriptional regulator
MGKRLKAKAPRTRRQEYAEETRLAILAAARKLFAERGYFATRVDDIAAEARVAPATVYAVGGGKAGLLHTVMELWSTAPIIGETIRGIEAMADVKRMIRLCADTCVTMRREFGDIIRVILNTAPNDEEIARMLAEGTDIYRKAIGRIGKRMLAVGGLRKGVDLDYVADMLWFYFGYSSLFTLVDENHWTWERAEQWLGDQAIRTLVEK